MDLGGVPQTTLWTLWNRATEVRPGGLLEGDEQCVAIRDKLLEDGVDFKALFGRANKSHAIRSYEFDNVVKDAAARAKASERRLVVVSLGEGLETQRFRLEPHLNPDALWFSVDLEPCIAVRERFIQPDSRHIHVSKSATTTQEWIAEVKTRLAAESGQCAPIELVLIASGLFMYLEQDEVGRILHDTHEAFAESGVAIFDLISPWLSSRTMSEQGWKLTDHYTTPAMPFGISAHEVPSWLTSCVPGSTATFVDFTFTVRSFEALVLWTLSLIVPRAYIPGHHWALRWGSNAAERS